MIGLFIGLGVVFIVMAGVIVVDALAQRSRQSRVSA